MAAYPSLPQDYNLDRQPIDGYEWDRADDGTVHGRSFFTATGYEITLTHPGINATQKATLDQFWIDNKGLLVDLTLDDTSEVLSVYMRGQPVYTPVAPGYWNADVSFIG